jgi:hypothetical protein
MAAPAAAAGRARGSGSRVTTIHDLPISALGLVFDQLTTLACPGVCLAAQVCKRWRDVATTAKGLRVVYASGSTAKALSMADWISRHAPCVDALTLVGPKCLWVLHALQGAAAKAMREGQPLGLASLIVYERWPADGCGLLGLLPHLQYLCMYPAVNLLLHRPPSQVAAAVRAMLAPLQHATSLTTLILDGPKIDPETLVLGTDHGLDAYQRGLDAAMEQTQALLPCSLKVLHWNPGSIHSSDRLVEPRASVVNLEHLTNLEEVRLQRCYGGDLPVASLAALPNLQRLQLWDSSETTADLRPLDSKLVEWGPSRSHNLAAGLQQLPGLTRLLLGVGPVYDRPLPPTGTWTGLRALLVEPMVEQDDDPGAEDEHGGLELDLGAMSHLQHLVKLDLLDVPWSLSPMQLTTLQRLTYLKLWFSSPAEDEAGVARLEAWRLSMGYLTNLVTLDTQMGMVAGKHMWLTNLPKLAVLQLRGCQTARLPEVADHMAAVERSSGGRQGLLMLHTWDLRPSAVRAFRASIAREAPSWQLMVGDWADLLWVHGRVCFTLSSLPAAIQEAVWE